MASSSNGSDRNFLSDVRTAVKGEFLACFFKSFSRFLVFWKRNPPELKGQRIKSLCTTNSSYFSISRLKIVLNFSKTNLFFSQISINVSFCSRGYRPSSTVGHPVDLRHVWLQEFCFGCHFRPVQLCAGRRHIPGLLRLQPRGKYISFVAHQGYVVYITSVAGYIINIP